MKRFFSGLVCATMLLTSGVAAFSVAFASKEKEPAVQASAASNSTPFTINTANIMKWKWDDDPASGTDAIKWEDGAPNTTTIDYTYSAPSASQNPKILISNPNDTKKFHAMYVPFSMTFANVVSLTMAKEFVTFKLSLYRTQPGSSSSADFSIELFAFGEDSSLIHSTYWYIQNNMTTTTGRGYSLYRLAGEKQVTSFTENVSYNYEKQNGTNYTQEFTLYFGVFAYMESSAVNSRLQASIELYSEQRTSDVVKYSIGDKCFKNFGDAVTEFNKSSGQTIKARQNDEILQASTYNLGQNGTIDMNGFTMYYSNSSDDAGSYLILLTSGKQLTVTNGTITSRLGTTIWVQPNSTLTITSTGVVGSTTSIDKGRAVYLQGNDSYYSDLYVQPGGVISSSKIGLRIGKGHAYIQGQVSGQQAAVWFESNSYQGYLYVYGSNAYLNQIVHITKMSVSYIYCYYNSTAWSNTASFVVEFDEMPAVGTTIIRSVTTSKITATFGTSEKHYRLAASGSTYVLRYIDYNVSYDFSSDFTHNGPSTTNYSADLSFTISPKENYSYLPTSISIYSGTTQLVVGTHYTYNSTTGAVVVDKEYITGAVSIQARTAPVYTITFVKGNDYEGTMSTIRVKRGSSFTLPECSFTKQYYSFRAWDVLNTERAPGDTFTPSANTNIYALWSQSDAQKVEYFIGVKLHFDKDVIDINNNADTGACKGEEGYYAVAKTYYNSMSSAVKTMFCENAEYANGRSRFIAWARANGEDLNLATHAIVSGSARGLDSARNNNTKALTIAIIAVTLVTSGSCLGLIIFKKRRHI